MEYDPIFGTRRDFYDFCKLIEKVEKVDPYAADLLRNHTKEDFYDFGYANSLLSCFVWERSVKGHEYWRDICSKY